MKKLLFTLALFAIVATSQAQTITYIATNDYIGNSRETINDNFSNMLASVHASASNSVVVTFTQMSSNWYYWVSNSVDGGISYWLGCNTNAAAGGAGTTAWLSNGTPIHAAASTVDVTGVSYTLASNSNGKVTLNLTSSGGSGATQAIATVGSSTVTSTISGATLSWSNAAAAGGSGGYWTGFVGFVTAMEAAGTNPTITANTLTEFNFATNHSNVKYDPGSLVDSTNQQWRLSPAGYWRGRVMLSVGHNTAVSTYGHLSLGVNGSIQTNAWSIYPAFPGADWTSTGIKPPWYLVCELLNIPEQWGGSIDIYNPSATNLFTWIGYVSVSSTLGTFGHTMTWEYLGP